jgi:hypothetical protein
VNRWETQYLYIDSWTKVKCQKKTLHISQKHPGQQKIKARSSLVINQNQHFFPAFLSPDERNWSIIAVDLESINQNHRSKNQRWKKVEKFPTKSTSYQPKIDFLLTLTDRFDVKIKSVPTQLISRKLFDQHPIDVDFASIDLKTTIHRFSIRMHRNWSLKLILLSNCVTWKFSRARRRFELYCRAVLFSIRGLSQRSTHLWNFQVIEVSKKFSDFFLDF